MIPLSDEREIAASVAPVTHDAEVVSQAILDKRNKMRRLLTEEFKNDPLFKIYEERGWLFKLFTDNILSMDVGVEYSSPEVAEICETAAHNINNKRKNLVNYVQPKTNDTNRNWMHDYKSVFKIKMIDGLAGKDGVYTINQLKAMLSETNGSQSGHDSFEVTEDITESIQHLLDLDPDKLRIAVDVINSPQFLNTMQYLVNPEFVEKLNAVSTLHKALPGPGSFDNIEEELRDKLSRDASEKVDKIVENATLSIERQMDELKSSQSKLSEVSLRCNQLAQKLSSPKLSIAEKENILNEFDELKQHYPDHLDLIAIHKSTAEDRLVFIRQEQNELRIKTLEQRALSLTETVLDDARTEQEREAASKELDEIFAQNQEISAYLRLQISTARRTQKMLSERTNQPELSGWRKVIARLIGIK